MNVKKRIAILVLLTALTASLFSACSGGISRDGQPAGNINEQAQTPGGNVDKEREEAKPPAGSDNGAAAGKDAAVLAGFDKLVSEDGKNPGKLFDFIRENVSGLSKEAVSQMVLKLEEVQKAYIAGLEERFISEGMEAKMAEVFLKDFSLMNKPERINDGEVKELITEAIDNGYRIDTAEGMFFPVIDYGAYRDFAEYTEDDIAEYIGIMAQHSGKLPAKDAALVIGWDEVVERALAQESFLSAFPQSERADAVKSLFKNYITYTLFGLNNTPLFDYRTKKMDEEAVKAYIDAVSSKGGKEGSAYLEQLGEFMELLDKNGYKLMQEADEYRNRILKSEKAS